MSSIDLLLTDTKIRPLTDKGRDFLDREMVRLQEESCFHPQADLEFFRRLWLEAEEEEGLSVRIEGAELRAFIDRWLSPDSLPL